MKTVRNKLHAPLKVPLPRGRKLHLAPGQSGQINDHAVDHEPLKKLIEEGSIEVVAEGHPDHVGEHGKTGPGPHARTHGFHQRQGGVRGDR